MKEKRALIKWRVLSLIVVLMQTMFISVSFANYGDVIQGGLCGMDSGYIPPTGNYTSNGTGATEHSQPGESDHQGYVHNVSMDKTEMSRSGSGDYNRKWTFVHGEVPVVNVRVRLKNKTNHKIHHDDVAIKWFESPNHTFNPSYDHHFATDHNKKSIGPFKHNCDNDELVEKKTNLKLKNLEINYYDIMNNIIIGRIKFVIKILFLKVFKNKILIDKCFK